MKLKSYILNDFFEILNENGVDYCVMNNYEGMPEIIPSDVDFAIEKEIFNKLDFFVYKLARKHNVYITQKIWHGYNKCAYILTPLDIQEYFWLQLDFFVDFCAKGYPNILPVEKMLCNKIKYKNFYVPKPIIEVPFVIQRRIIKGDLKKAHLKLLNNLYVKNSKTINNVLFNMFGRKLGLILIDTINSQDKNPFNQNLDTFRLKLREISNDNLNLVYKLKYAIHQVKRAFYRVIYPTGISVAIIGDNIEMQERLIHNIDKVVSGSFHGTFNSSPSSILRYLYPNYFKIIWAKITKRKVFINISTNEEGWNNTSLWLLCNFCLLRPDMIFSMKFYEKDEYLDIEKGEIKKITYSILEKQMNRTKKHLFNALSPTSKNKKEK